MISVSTPVARKTIGFLASPATRREGGSAHRFVQQHLAELRNYHIVATGGAYDDLIKGRPELDAERYPGHKEGGLVMIGADIADETCHCLIHFADPDKEPNPLSTSVLDQAIWSNVPAIVNNLSGDLWISGRSGVVNQSEETIALIAHSDAVGREPKSEMVDFARAFTEELLGFNRILCTGTTAQTLHKEVPGLRPKLYMDFKSGMKGGDFQIAREIVQGRCQHSIFLINPGWSQPHGNAVATYVFTTRHFLVNSIYNPKDAWRWGEVLRNELQG